MEILQQLGLNDSYFFQFIIFLIAYIIMSQVLFKPYADAFQQREDRTKGGEELAVETNKAAQDLRSTYETKARSVSTEIKNIFDEQKTLANKEYEQIVTTARQQSQKIIDETRTRINSELEIAKKQVQEIVPTVSAEMTKKLLSK
jgi:F-type H+-transporting ATPase subunit b